MNKIDKNELFNKLSKAKPEDIKKIGPKPMILGFIVDSLVVVVAIVVLILTKHF